MRKQLTALVAVIGLTGAILVAGAGAGGAGENDDEGAGPSELTEALDEIESKPRYRQSDWGYAVVDLKSGDTVAAQNSRKMFDPGSSMKTYAVSTALRLYGPEYEFHTPVYRQGNVAGSNLNGDLVLVASGDLSLGLREQPDGTLSFENAPEIDHSYANIGLPGAVEPPGNPLAGLDELAAAVRASGITQVNGDVVIDDRLFTTYDGFPDGLISPIWVNENLIDIEVTPGEAGQTATIDWRPMTATYTVESQVTTVEAKKETSLEVTQTAPGHLVVAGEIAADSDPRLTVYEIDDPSAFARTAFIEALQRAGVTVDAGPTGPNPSALLPAEGSYQPGDLLGEHISATLAEFVNLIMKVSYNRAADLMTCLAAVEAGSKDCEDGLVEEAKTVDGFDISRTDVFIFDGAGSNDQDRSTPAAMAEFYQRARSTDYGDALFDALCVLGRSGSLANILPRSPVAGNAQIKPGSRVVGTGTGQLLALGNSLAGYIEAKSGKRLAFMIAVGNVPVSSTDEFLKVAADQARMVEAIHQAL